jgi:hypothetical protein
MFRDTKKLMNVLVKIKADTTDTDFINIVCSALDDVLSLNDFNTLIERLEEDVQEDIEE